MPRGQRLHVSSHILDYSAFNQLLAQIDEHNKKARDYWDAAKAPGVGAEQAGYYNGFARSEQYHKTELVRQTGLMAFINKRCQQHHIEFKNGGSFLASDGSFRTEYSYYLSNVPESYTPSDSPKLSSEPFQAAALQKLAHVLKKIGIPENHIQRIIYYDYPDGEKGNPQRKKVPLEYLRVWVASAVIKGLIDKVVKEKVDRIKDASSRRGSNIASMITEETEMEVIDDGSKRDKRGFTTAFFQELESDVRKKVTTDILGKLGKTEELEEGFSL